MVVNNNAIEERLDVLPEVYLAEPCRQKCDVLYRHLSDSYPGPGRSAYAQGGLHL